MKTPVCCKYNCMVDCNYDTNSNLCHRCGWNPTVQAERKKHNKESMAGNPPERQIWKYV